MKEVLIIGGVILVCFWAISVVVFLGCLLKDMLEETKEDEHY